MHIKIAKSDMEEFIWLQELIEAILVRETVERAQSKGHIPAGENWLHDQVIKAYPYPPYTVDVSYSDRMFRSTGEYQDRYTPRYTESYTLSEIVQLAMASKQE